MAHQRSRAARTDNDLDDQSWENPFDVAKGHRGFLDGDIVMMMYAWAPNWNSNTVGNDHYNLYVRRSFDGGSDLDHHPGELGRRWRHRRLSTTMVPASAIRSQ